MWIFNLTLWVSFFFILVFLLIFYFSIFYLSFCQWFSCTIKELWTNGGSHKDSSQPEHTCRQYLFQVDLMFSMSMTHSWPELNSSYPGAILFDFQLAEITERACSVLACFAPLLAAPLPCVWPAAVSFGHHARRFRNWSWPAISLCSRHHGLNWTSSSWG